MLTVADAARVARRSVRTIRRAYLSGGLVAHRDGNGRRVTIRYGDLRAWLMARRIALAPAQAPARAVGQAGSRKRADRSTSTGNLELLSAARRHRPRPALASGAGRPAVGRAGSQTA